MRKGLFQILRVNDGVKNVKTFLSDGKNIGAIGSRCMKDCKDDGAKLVL